MKINFFIAQFLLLISSFSRGDDGVNRDPFLPSQQMACSEQQESLLKQIKVWQFKGIIAQANNSYHQIWLYSENQWLSITDDIVPHVLFPWFIQSLQNNQIIWQANLTNYCHDTVQWMMQLNEQ